MRTLGHLCLLICGGLFLFSVQQAHGRDSFVVAVNHAPPYRIIDQENRVYSGFYVDIMRALAKRMDFDLTFRNVPFKRALVLMEHGAADLMLGPNRTPEREVYMAYLNVELPRERKVFYTHDPDIRVERYEDLQGKRISVLAGASYSDRFDNDDTLLKEMARDHKLSLRQLVAGRVDLAVMPELLGDYILANMNMNVNLNKTTYAIAGRESFFALSRSSRLMERKKEMETTLSEMIGDGTVGKINRKYR